MASLKRVIQVTFQDDGGLERHIRQVKQSKQEAAGLGTSLQKSFAGVQAFLAGAFVATLGRVVQKMAEVGAAAEETRARFETTFGGAGGALRAFVDQNAHLLGITKRIGQEFAATAGAIAQAVLSIGLGRDRAGAGSLEPRRRHVQVISSDNESLRKYGCR